MDIMTVEYIYIYIYIYCLYLELQQVRISPTLTQRENIYLCIPRHLPAADVVVVRATSLDSAAPVVA